MVLCVFVWVDPYKAAYSPVKHILQTQKLDQPIHSQ